MRASGGCDWYKIAGSWGFNPNESDAYLDRLAEYAKEFLPIVRQDLKEAIENVDNDAGELFRVLGVINTLKNNGFLTYANDIWEEGDEQIDVPGLCDLLLADESWIGQWSSKEGIINGVRRLKNDLNEKYTTTLVKHIDEHLEE